MVLNSLKNFLKCFLYFTVPLGCIFIGFLIGLSALGRCVAEQFSYMVDEVAKLIPETEENLGELGSYVLSAARELDWSRPLQTIDVLFRGEWLAQKISEFLGLTMEQFNALADHLSGIALNVVTKIGESLLLLLVYVVVGAVCGYFVTNYFVRRNTVRRGIVGFLISSAVNAIASVLFVAFMIWVGSVLNVRALSTVINVLGIVVYAFVSLLEAYLIQGRGRVSFKKVVNLRNCILLFLSHTVVFLLAIVISAIVLAVADFLVGIFVAVSILLVALLVINVNAESYVDRLAVKLREKESLTTNDRKELVGNLFAPPVAAQDCTEELSAAQTADEKTKQ